MKFLSTFTFKSLFLTKRRSFKQKVNFCFCELKKIILTNEKCPFLGYKFQRKKIAFLKGENWSSSSSKNCRPIENIVSCLTWFQDAINFDCIAEQKKQFSGC